MYIKQFPNCTFFDWLRSPIETKDGMVYEDVCDADYYSNPVSKKPITHANFISSVFNDIDKILQNNNYHLDNIKLFKSELADIIYKFSDHSKYGPL